MEDPTLTVILMNYNQACFLEESYLAIIRQSYQPIQIILTDDGSTDGSLEVLDQLVGIENIELVLNKVRRGNFPTANEVLYKAKGDYIAYFAADDRIAPGLLEQSMNLLRQYPQAGLCFAPVGYMDKSGQEINQPDRYLSDKPCYIEPLELARRLRKKRITGLPAAGSIVKKSLLLELGGLKSEWRWHGDWLIQLIFGFEHGACYIPQKLVDIRILPDSYSHKKTRADQIQVLESMIAFIAKKSRLVLLFRRSCVLQAFGIQALLIIIREQKYWPLLSFYYTAKVILHSILKKFKRLKVIRKLRSLKPV